MSLKRFAKTSCLNHTGAILLLCLLSPTASQAQSNYLAFELEQENNWQQQLVLEDLNGDGRKDIVYANYQPGIGRELHLFYQQIDGSFSTTAQKIEIKTEIIAIGFADLRPLPGKELIMFSNSGVFSLSAAIEAYSGNIKQLLQWELIAAVPDLERVQFITDLKDIDNDGEIDLLLPGDNVYGFFKGTGSETFNLVSTFSTSDENGVPVPHSRNEGDIDARISINADTGVMIQLVSGSNSHYDGFIEQWNKQAQQSRSLLRTENWMPTAVLAHLNADNLLDIAYINRGEDGLGQLNIHFQNSQSGFTEKPDWTGSLNTSGDIQLVDMDNDQQLDLLRVSGEGNSRTVYFFRNHNGAFDLQLPNQVMRFSGYDVRVNLIHVEDGLPPLLNVAYYTIPVIDVIRNASINRTQLLFDRNSSEPDQFFNRRPDSRLDESFSAADVRALSEQMSLLYDVDGDGRKDALYITENGTLAAKRINENLVIAGDPFWEYVSSRNVFEFEVLQLNQDAKPDLLLRHGSTTSLLVASP